MLDELSELIVGTPYHLENSPDGWVVMCGSRVLDGPYPYWSQAWLAAMELAVEPLTGFGKTPGAGASDRPA